jgi:hypothetical protein
MKTYLIHYTIGSSKRRRTVLAATAKEAGAKVRESLVITKVERQPELKPDGCVSVNEAKKKFNISRPVIYRLVETGVVRGRIRKHRTGCEYLAVDLAGLKKYLKPERYGVPRGYILLQDVAQMRSTTTKGAYKWLVNHKVPSVSVPRQKQKGRPAQAYKLSAIKAAMRS